MIVASPLNGSEKSTFLTVRSLHNKEQTIVEKVVFCLMYLILSRLLVDVDGLLDFSRSVLCSVI